jgi:hypothetical protein
MQHIFFTNMCQIETSVCRLHARWLKSQPLRLEFSLRPPRDLFYCYARPTGCIPPPRVSHAPTQHSETLLLLLERNDALLLRDISQLWLRICKFVSRVTLIVKLTLKLENSALGTWSRAPEDPTRRGWSWRVQRDGEMQLFGVYVVIVSYKFNHKSITF